MTPILPACNHAFTSGAMHRVKVGDRPQGVAGDCNSLAETHAWFDSRVAHHSVFLKPPTICLCGRVFIFPWVMGKWCTRDLTNHL